MFEPNPKIVQQAIDVLLGIQPGGGKGTLDDALFFANEQKHGYPEDHNSHIFWNAVYNELETLRKERTKL